MLFRCKNVFFIRKPSSLGFNANKHVIFIEIILVPCLKFQGVHSGNQNKITLRSPFDYLENLLIIYFNTVLKIYICICVSTYIYIYFFFFKQQPLVLFGRESGVGSNDLLLHL